MTIFKVGDRVIYTGASNGPAVQRGRIGHLGTVSKFIDHKNITVVWDTAPKDWSLVAVHLPENLALYEADVGDLQDDI